MDATQRRMIAIVLNLRKDPDDTPEVYARRRGRLAAKTQTEMGIWSHKWANCIVNWDEHLHGPRNASSWACKLLTLMPPEELARRRADTGRPQCRAQAGWVCRRWYESIVFAQNITHERT